MRAPRFNAVLAATLAAVSLPALALPISFGRNQGEVVYDEVRSANFYLYHDARTPREGKMMLEALEAARPTMERWFQEKRAKPLPVIVSATTSGASFANFITDAIELQTLGQGGRDLAWHEYTHSTMYRHLDNWIGPAGSVIHLPWMPAWWIEGLAEALSQSTGSDAQAGIERYHALSGHWPSYDKLHSLYNRRNFTTQGYATSGAFVSYLLRTYDASKLPQVLNDFFHYSMPWWWPWAAVPFNGFMPMDAALKNWTGKSGEELYDEYKRAATTYWRSQEAGPFLQHRLRGMSRFSSTAGLQVRGDHLYHIVQEDYDIKEIQLRFDKNGHWATGWKTVALHPDEIFTARLMLPKEKVYVTSYLPNNMERVYYLWHQAKGKEQKPTKLAERPGLIVRLFATPSHFVWLEDVKETSQLCRLPRKITKSPAPKPECFATTRTPDQWFYLGEENHFHQKEQQAKAVWLRQSSETLAGDRHQLLRIDLQTGAKTLHPYRDGGKPLGFVQHQNRQWLLVADVNSRFLREVGSDGRCLKELPVADHVTRILGMANGDIVMTLYQGPRELVYKTAPEKLKARACRPVLDHDSPLLAAMRANGDLSLPDAMTASSIWKSRSAEEVKTAHAAVDSAPTSDSMNHTGHYSVGPAKTRVRPLFAFPWIGADAEGTQLGFISVPLMDHMQNETVRVNFLYGVNSQFPQTELMLMTNRFATTYSLNIFRTQTYNGAIGTDLLFYDERGALLTAYRYLPALNLQVDLGWRSTTLKPIIGPPNFILSGHQNELSLGLVHTTSVNRFIFTQSLSASALPAALNERWEYNRLGFGTGVSFPLGLFSWRTTSLSLGLSASGTRGPKPKVLREVYRPLKTFVPGTGGGFNEINVGLLGPGFLTSAQYGDTQARARASWVFPLVYDLEKVIGIFYFERLDFTMFYNYGGAWYQNNPPDFKDMIAAHGYNLDLQSDIKGVTVNAGLGTGQVVGQKWEVYFLFGFDALIN